METTKLNFFQRLFHSITDFTFYQNVVKEKTGRAVGYIVLLALLISLIIMIKPTVELLNGVDTLSTVFDSDVPDFEFINGELTIKSEKPIIIDEGGQLIVIDTSGQYNESILTDYESGILITKTYMINKKNAFSSERTDFSELSPLTFTKDQVLTFLPNLKYFSILMVLWFIISTIVSKLFGALIVSLLALIINAIMKTKLMYSEVFRVGIYAMTLPSLIKAAASFLPKPIPLFFVIYYVIVGIYIVKAFSLIQDERKILADKEPLTPLY